MLIQPRGPVRERISEMTNQATSPGVNDGVGWLFVEPDVAFGDGECQVSAQYWTSELLPNHAALPAVATWLAETPIALDDLLDGIIDALDKPRPVYPPYLDRLKELRAALAADRSPASRKETT